MKKVKSREEELNELVHKHLLHKTKPDIKGFIRIVVESEKKLLKDFSSESLGLSPKGSLARTVGIKPRRMSMKPWYTTAGIFDTSSTGRKCRSKKERESLKDIRKEKKNKKINKSNTVCTRKDLSIKPPSRDVKFWRDRFSSKNKLKTIQDGIN